MCCRRAGPAAAGPAFCASGWTGLTWAPGTTRRRIGRVRCRGRVREVSPHQALSPVQRGMPHHARRSARRAVVCQVLSPRPERVPFGNAGIGTQAPPVFRSSAKAQLCSLPTGHPTAGTRVIQARACTGFAPGEAGSPETRETDVRFTAARCASRPARYRPGPPHHRHSPRSPHPACGRGSRASDCDRRGPRPSGAGHGA